MANERLNAVSEGQARRANGFALLRSVAHSDHRDKHADQHRRRNLRIAMRQLERAELYLEAMRSLDLQDQTATELGEDLLKYLRSLQHYLLQLKLDDRVAEGQSG
jgi:phage gp16-like protein